MQKENLLSCPLLRALLYFWHQSFGNIGVCFGPVPLVSL
jgi:hypothetical protein